MLQPRDGLVELARHMAFADLFISNSTGPLHIAGALDRPTAAFYPRHRSGTPLRWQPLNSPDKRLAFVPPASIDAKDVAGIDLVAAANLISERFLLYSNLR
jgi:ADP-heptose:LPS heptosyltransferase